MTCNEIFDAGKPDTFFLKKYNRIRAFEVKCRLRKPFCFIHMWILSTAASWGAAPVLFVRLINCRCSCFDCIGLKNAPACYGEGVVFLGYVFSVVLCHGFFYALTYFCRRLFGLSGTVIFSFPEAKSGFKYLSLKLFLPVRPRCA